MNNSLIVLFGPTGVGKTDVCVKVALHFGSEIISADSRQFYKEMRIGTAVPSDEQLSSVKHHFIRFLSIHDHYSSSLYEKDVMTVMPGIFSKNSIAFLTGGSGLYIDAVCSRIDDIPDVENAIRQKYIKKYREEGLESLRIALKILDPEHYAKVDLKNPKRIIRSLEICESTGRPYSSFLKQKKVMRDFNIIMIGLQRERKELYERINKRVDMMIEEGLETEARELYPQRHLNALNTVGYKEFFEYFDKKISRERAIELIKRNTRRYAKRQITWWNKDREIKWFSPDNTEEIINYIEEQVRDCQNGNNRGRLN